MRWCFVSSFRDAFINKNCSRKGFMLYTIYFTSYVLNECLINSIGRGTMAKTKFLLKNIGHKRGILPNII